MQLRTAARSSRPTGGFTLIELMVVVAIATILFAIAVPSYMTYVRQSRRVEAKTAVLDLAGARRALISAPTPPPIRPPRIPGLHRFRHSDRQRLLLLGGLHGAPSGDVPT